MNKTVLPPSTIGIIGGGQLGRMMAIAARQMGYGIAVLEPSVNSPLGQIADLEWHAAYDDKKALVELLEQSDVVTYEFENVPYATVRELASFGNLPQGAMPLIVTSHRLREKLAIEEAGYQVAPFLAVMSQDELKYAIKKIGYPCILKTASGGYDGKGQWVLRSDADLPDVLAIIDANEYILEGFVNFTKEVSVIVTRSITGEIEVFPVTENEHVNQILHVSLAPAQIDASLRQEAETIAQGLIEKLDFVGTLAIEMFVTKEGIVINELAPRPHNSGHWTIDGCTVSQFEQHVRAICGLPLVKPQVRGYAVMVNLLGQHVDEALTAWQQPEFQDAKLHLYGKDEMKRNRKVGHLNFIGDDWHKLKVKVDRFLARLPE
ncbi:MAG: 5-(carboxyamino)imidazole ribonucleotide synthase [Defluviitaleaceae bacterium]|nr:5-(carboxyamino)imidazole ribonucleotide synthase [Defluviitaleaceae bacterium]